MTDIDEHTADHLVIYHPDGRMDRKEMSAEVGAVVRLGREMDNDIALPDPRVSRHHAQIRRGEHGLEIRDVGSANGTMIGTTLLTDELWHPLAAGQAIALADTRIFWEPAAASRATLGMPPVGGPPPTPAAGEGRRSLPLLVLGAAIVLALLLVGGALFLFNRPGPEEAATPGSGSTGLPSLAQQTPSDEEAAADTPTPAEPLIPIPSVTLESVEVAPIILGALPDTGRAWLYVRVRVENLGNAPFTVSTGQFSLVDAEGATLTEAGGGFSAGGLRRLGLADRFEDLRLQAGGSVPESLIFALDATSYELNLTYAPQGLPPVTLELGQIDAGRELALALGTPVAEDTPTAEAVAAVTASPTPAAAGPTPTATRPPISAPRTVPQASLQGTIAYPAFQGTTYDLYLGDVASGESRLYRNEASQPAFSPDGARIAFHSWSGSSRGLVTASSGGGQEFLITNFLEDQLPTWSPDGSTILFLSRRTGGRQSELYRTQAAVDFLNSEAQMLIEGEYPAWGANGQIAFKGWGNTAFGLRLASADLANIDNLTLADEDTAPALSPDGKQVAFMARREDNWDVYLVNVDGSGLKRLTTDPAMDGLPAWSPDGNVIAFVSNRGGPWAIWAMTPEGTGTRQLITMVGSPDGFVNSDTSNFETRGWAEERISWTR
ncbi:MAG: FHA domain-containing protein [Anaerolineae bacterium]